MNFNSLLRRRIQSKIDATRGIYHLKSSSLICLSTSIVFFGSSFVSVKADMPESIYRYSLKIAEKKTHKKSILRARAQNFPFSAIRSIFGRDFQVGDHWTVAAWQIRPSTMRMTNEESHLQNQITDGGLFRYEVTQITSSPDKQVILQIKQLNSKDFKIIDPNVQYLNLRMDDRLNQNEKTYYFNGKTEGIQVSPDQIHSAITPLELLPLDIPEILTAEKHRNNSESISKILPDKISKKLKELNIIINLNQSIRFEQDDFFGRPIAAFWDKGNPWPTLVKTANGISILIQGDL